MQSRVHLIGGAFPSNHTHDLALVMVDTTNGGVNMGHMRKQWEEEIA
jgi:hypothetical protein